MNAIVLIMIVISLMVITIAYRFYVVEYMYLPLDALTACSHLKSSFSLGTKVFTNMFLLVKEIHSAFSPLFPFFFIFCIASGNGLAL